jgi:hypothetical protein
MMEPSALSHCERVTSVTDSAIAGTFISITAILYGKLKIKNEEFESVNY